jgi:hypothetical protein
MDVWMYARTRAQCHTYTHREEDAGSGGGVPVHHTRTHTHTHTRREEDASSGCGVPVHHMPIPQDLAHAH